MNVLVTGGAGFIGGHTAAELRRRGHHVTILDNLSTGLSGNVPSGSMFQPGDVRDTKRVREAMRGQDGVIHLAAFVSLPDSFEHADECLAVNVGGTANVIEAAVAEGVTRIVLASSSAVYSADPSAAKSETDTPEPGSPYADSKLQAESLLRGFDERGGRGVALRYFNVYGPRQTADSDYAAVIPLFVQRALEHRPLTVYGDGGQTRDFVYVEDVARANVAAMSCAAAGPFNIGTGEEVSVLTLARRILELTGSRSAIDFAGSRPGDVPACTADVEWAREGLQWSAATPLASGLAQTIQWWKQQSAVATTVGAKERGA